MEEENEAESAKPEWRDAINDNKDGLINKSVIVFNGFGITVHKCKDIPGNSWYLSCPSLCIERRCLFKTVLKAAQVEALDVVIKMIESHEEKKQMIEVFLLNNGK